MRSAIEHAQDVVYWWVRPVAEVLFYFIVFLSRVTFRTQLFLTVIFSLLLFRCAFFPKTERCNFCGSFGVFVFQVVLKNF